MREATLANPTLHMNSQVFTLFQAFAHTPIEIHERLRISTSPYCNCREQGFVISLCNYPQKRTNYAFYEHRNSDSICCLKWEGQTNITGAITPDDIPSEVFPDKYSVTKSWNYMEIKEVIDWMVQEVKSISNKVETELKKEDKHGLGN